VTSVSRCSTPWIRSWSASSASKIAIACDARPICRYAAASSTRLPQKRSTRNRRNRPATLGIADFVPLCGVCLRGLGGPGELLLGHAWRPAAPCRGVRTVKTACLREVQNFPIPPGQDRLRHVPTGLHVFGISGPDLPETLGFWAKNRSRVPSFCGTLVKAGDQRAGMIGAEDARRLLDGALASANPREPPSAQYIQVTTCAVEQPNDPQGLVEHALGGFGKRGDVREQLLRARPSRRIRWVGWECVLKRGDGALDRARVRNGRSVVAHDLLQQAVHADSVVLHCCEAEARERVERISQALLLKRHARVDQDGEQRAGNRVRSQMGGSASSSSASGALALAAWIDALHVEATVWV
jgi:hypothetical protein